MGLTELGLRPRTIRRGDQYLGRIVEIAEFLGAGGTIGADNVAKSAPDGYSLLMTTVGTHAINFSLYKNLPYDAVRDFTPIVLVAAARGKSPHWCGDASSPRREK